MKYKFEHALTNIDDKFIDETITYMQQNHKNKHLLWTNTKKLVACAAITLVCVGSILSGSVIFACTSGNVEAYRMLYTVAPDIAPKLVPVQKSCVDNGIKMQVDAINIENNSADIYISLQDIDADRLDETVDLFDSYSIHTSADQMNSCRLVSYDTAKKTATFLISVKQNRKITGQYMKFSLSKILTGKQHSTLSLTQVKQAKTTDAVTSLSDVDLRGSSGDTAPSLLLLSNVSQHRELLPGAALTAYGFIENKLHVQVYYEDILKYDNHGWLYLKNGNETINPVENYAFWDEEQKGSYEEYIFQVSPSELQNYDIEGDFTTCQTVIEGNWQVAFPIEKQ